LFFENRDRIIFNGLQILNFFLNYFSVFCRKYNRQTFLSDIEVAESPVFTDELEFWGVEKRV